MLSAQKIAVADIIFVGGGKTYQLMFLLRRFGIDEMLKQAYADGKVMCGTSAGAVCMCAFGNCNARVKDGVKQQVRGRGLGLSDVLFCPHYVTQKFRAASLEKMMKNTYRIPTVGLENAALKIVDDQFRVLRLEEGAVAKKCYWKRYEYMQEDLDYDDFSDLTQLLSKGG